MKSVKIIVNEYVRKADGKSFTKAHCKGKFIPLAVASEEVDYVVKFVGSVMLPTKAGIYEVAFEDNGMWIDRRPEFADKNILRIRATRVVFSKPLTATKVVNALNEDEK